jgi:hypothetical protein
MDVENGAVGLSDTVARLQTSGMGTPQLGEKVECEVVKDALSNGSEVVPVQAELR